MASRKKKPAVPTEDMSEEEIQIYIDSMPQQSKIMMHRNLAQWRNMTVNNIHRAVMRAWQKWNVVVHAHFRTEKAKADEKSAAELKEYAIAALNKPTHERSAMDVKTIVNWFKLTNIFGKIKPNSKALRVIAREAAIWNGAPNTPVFFQGQRADGSGPGARHAWWQWGCYVMVSGKVNLYSFSDRAQEAHALTRFVVSRPSRTPGSGAAGGGRGSAGGGGGGGGSLMSDWNQDDDEEDDENSVYSANDGDPFNDPRNSSATPQQTPGSGGGGGGPKSLTKQQPGSSRGSFTSPASPNVRFFPMSPNGQQQPGSSSGGLEMMSPMTPGGTPLNPMRTKNGVPIPKQLPSPMVRRSSSLQMADNINEDEEQAQGNALPVEASVVSSSGGAFGNNENSTLRTYETSLSNRSPLSFEPSSPAYLPPSAYATFFPKAQEESKDGGSGSGNSSAKLKEPGSPNTGESPSPGLSRGMSRRSSFNNNNPNEPLSPGGGGGSGGRLGSSRSMKRSSSKGNLNDNANNNGNSSGNRPNSKGSNLNEGPSPSLRRKGTGGRLANGAGGSSGSNLAAEGGSGGQLAMGQGHTPPTGGSSEPMSGGGGGGNSSSRSRMARSSSSRGVNNNGKEPDSSRSNQGSINGGGDNASVDSVDNNTVDSAFAGVDFLTSGVLGDLIFSASGFGHTFGEVSLVDPSRPERSAAAVCAEQCQLLVVGPEAFKRSLALEYGDALHMDTKMAYLERPGGLFTKWRAAQLSQFAYVMKPVRFLPRDVLAMQGKPIDRYYFIHTGTVRSVMTLRPAGGGGGSGGSGSGGGDAADDSTVASGAGMGGMSGGGFGAAAVGHGFGAGALSKKGQFEVDVGRMGVGSVVDDVGLVEGQLKFTATFVAETVVECFSVKVSEMEKALANGIGPAKLTYRDLRNVAESRREMRFSKVSEAKRKFARALDHQVAEAKRAPPPDVSSNSSSSGGGGSGGAGTAAGSGARAAATVCRHGVGKGRFTSAAYDVAWALSQAKPDKRKTTTKQQLTQQTHAQAHQLGGGGGGSRADPKTLSNDVLKFTKVRGTGAESKEHLPTHSAFSLIQTINEPFGE